MAAIRLRNALSSLPLVIPRLETGSFLVLTFSYEHATISIESSDISVPPTVRLVKGNDGNRTISSHVSHFNLTQPFLASRSIVGDIGLDER